MTTNMRVKKKHLDAKSIDGTKIELQSGEALVAQDPSQSNQSVELLKIGSDGKVLAKGQEIAFKADLTQEVADRDAAVLAEQSARISADSDEAAARAEEDASLRAAVLAEQSARIAADSLELSSRQAAITALSQKVDTLQNQDDTIDGSLAKVLKDAKIYTNLKVDDEKASRQAAVNAEITARNTQVTNEANTRGQNDESLRSAIDSERASRISDVYNEAQARYDGDGRLEGLINTETADRQNADQGLYNAISDEADYRQQGDNALDARLDVVEGDENTAGSIKKALKDAKAYADSLDTSANSRITDKIDAEVASRQAAVLAEKTRAMAAEGNLQTGLSNEANTRYGQDQYLEGRINDEAGFREQGDLGLNTRIDNEANYREQADNALDARLDVVEGDENTAGSIKKALKDAKAYADSLDTSANSRITDKIDAEVASRQAAVLAEKTRAMAAEGGLQTNINTEAATRYADDQTLHGRIDTEITNRQNADYNLSNQISDEANYREQADNDLDARLDVVEGNETVVGSIKKALKDAKDYADSLDTSANSRITDKIDAEVASRQAAVLAEKTRAMGAEGALSVRLDYVEGDENTVGSVKKALKDAKGYTDAKTLEEKTRAMAAEAALGGRIDRVISNTDPAALDSLSEIVAAFQTADGSLQGAIVALSNIGTVSVSAEITSRQAAVNAEVTSRQAAVSAEADTRAADDLTEKTRAMAAEAALQASINGETAARQAAVSAEANTRAADDLTEKTRAMAAEATLRATDENLSSRIDTLMGGETVAGSISASLSTAKSYTDGKFLEEKTRATLAENVLTAALLVEKTRAMGVESTLRANLNQESYDRLGYDESLRIAIDNLKVDLDLENTARIDREIEIDGRIDEEITSRQAAIAALQGGFNSETSSRSNNDESLRVAINGLRIDLDLENTARIDREIEIDGRIDAEISSRQSADSYLQSQINDLTGGSGMSLGSLSSGLLDEKSARIAADNTLQAAVNAEVTSRQAAVSAEANTRSADDLAEKTRAMAAESSLQSAIVSVSQEYNTLLAIVNSDLETEQSARIAGDNSELTARQAADSSLRSAIDQERSDRLAASVSDAATVAANLAAEITSRQSAVNTEKTRAMAAESAVQAAVDAEKTRAMAAESTLQSSASSEAATRSADDLTEKSARIAADNTLQAAVNAEVTSRQAAVSAEANTRSADDLAEKTRAMAAESSLQSAINAEVSARAADVLAEKTRAMAAESTLQSSASSEASTRAADDLTEKTARMAADSSLQAAVDAEVAARQSAVNAEKTRALAAEAALGVRIDNVISNVDSAALDSLSEIVAAFQTADGSLQGAVSTLAANSSAGIQAEVTSRQAAVSAEAATRAADDLTEKSARMAADNALQAAISSEITSRSSADAYLQSQIDSLSGAGGGGGVSISSLSGSILDEKTARIAADNALDARLDVLEAVSFYKESYTLDSVSAASNGYVLLDKVAKSGSLVVSVDRLMLHEGVDYEVGTGTKNGVTVTKISWKAGSSIAGGDEDLVSGDVVRVQYMA